MISALTDPAAALALAALALRDDAEGLERAALLLALPQPGDASGEKP